MIKKLVAHGNSVAIIIDKPILELLGINRETPLEIITDGKNLIIAPVDTVKRKKKFKAAIAKINRLHGKTLKKLAG